MLKHEENEDERFSEASFAALNDQKVHFPCLFLQLATFSRSTQAYLEEVNKNLKKNLTDAAKELDFLQV